MATGTPDLTVEVGLQQQRVLSQLTQLEARMVRAAQRSENGFKRANRNISQGFDGATRSVQRFAGGQGLRMAALQLNQVAQQGAVTGDYIRALSIQMPDLLLAFGTFGALAGVAAGALIPFVQGLIQSGEKAKSVEEILTDLNDAMQSFAKASDRAREPIGDLVKDYGAFAERAAELLVVQRQLAYLDSAQTLSNAASAATELFGQLERITQEGYQAPEWLQQIEERFGNLNPNAVAAVADALAITTDEAIILTRQIAALQASANDGPEAVAEALRNVIEQLELATGGAFEMNEETRAYYENLLLAEDAALRLAAVDIAQGVRAAADESERLLRNLLATRQQEIAAAGKVYSGRGGDPRTSNQQGYGEFRYEGPSLDANNNPKTKSSSASSEARKMQSDATAMFNATRTAAENYRIELDKIQELYDLGLISEETKTRAMAELERGFNGAAAGAQAFENAVEGAFVSFVTGAESAREAIGNLLGDLARLAAQAAFRNLMGSAGGAGDAIGKIFGVNSFDGGGFTGFGVRAGGIDGKGGRLSIMHPNETVIDHTKGQGGANVVVNFNVDARGSRDSGMAANSAIPGLKAAVVAAVKDAQRRGY